MPWLPSIPTSEIDEDNIASAQVGDIWVALYRADNNYYATSVVCSHGQASLADGYLEDFQIECPLHQGTFDIRTGEAVELPCTVPVKTYPVRVENGIIMVEVADDGN